MAIEYPGGTIVHTTFTGGTKTQICNAVNTHLKTAGWSVISGDGTGDVVLQSAANSNGNSIYVRIRDSVVTNCCQFNMQNGSLTKVSLGTWLLPGASKTFRIIANKYYFFCFTPGNSAREYMGMGTLHVPSFLGAATVGELGWMNGNVWSDSDTTGRRCFRTSLTTETGWGGGLVNNALTNFETGGNQEPGSLRFVTLLSAAGHSFSSGWRWHDDSILVSDALMAWGLNSIYEEAKVRGQLHGAMIIADEFVSDTVLTGIDGHDWLAITGSNTGGAQNARGTLFVAIS